MTNKEAFEPLFLCLLNIHDYKPYNSGKVKMSLTMKIKSFLIFFKEEQNEGVFVAVKPNEYTKETFYQWFENQGVENLVPKEELHTTVIFSRKYIPYRAQGKIKTPIVINPETYKIQKLGPTALVLKFESEELIKLHQKGMNMGATYDFDSYIPHMTITYEGENLSEEFVNLLKVPNFPLVFDYEYTSPLDLSKLSNS